MVNRSPTLPCVSCMQENSAKCAWVSGQVCMLMPSVHGSLWSIKEAGSLLEERGNIWLGFHFVVILRGELKEEEGVCGGPLAAGGEPSPSQYLQPRCKGAEAGSSQG